MRNTTLGGLECGFFLAACLCVVDGDAQFAIAAVAFAAYIRFVRKTP